MKSKLTIAGIESLSAKSFDVGLSITYVLFDEFLFLVFFCEISQQQDNSWVMVLADDGSHKVLKEWVIGSTGIVVCF